MLLFQLRIALRYFPPSVLQCPHPPAIVNGKHSAWGLEDFDSGTYVNYSCDPGYLLIGESSIWCTASGMWSLPRPQCEAIRCMLPEVPGIRKAIEKTGYQFGENATLECNDGFVMEGSPIIRCQEDLSWDPPVPVCKAGRCIANRADKASVLHLRNLQ
uniref:Sushi domain-containing protein n=1 Tax=Sphenodon punctatus TaxID=8508 RepID=A0A8D0HJL3_SPHPU